MSLTWCSLFPADKEQIRHACEQERLRRLGMTEDTGEINQDEQGTTSNKT